ncbi:MAG: hypothetical protein LBE20_01185 [Deltaproteobacteria bacterium]|jgi:regulatory protein YycI of two-component signal transduction system YycFG|nr:hypothetical protein [Deltaproteobacteria bacterium]
MKWLFIIVFLFLCIFGGTIIFQEQNTAQEKREVTRYMNTKGAANIPKSWRETMGEGI